MSARLGWVACAVLCLGAVVGSVRLARRADPVAGFEPARLTVPVGETREARLVTYAAGVGALRLRLRFDERVVDLDVAATPARLGDGAAAVHLPIRRAPGLVEVEGIALTGGRAFEPGSPLYRFAVRGMHPGTTAVQIEELQLVVQDEAPRVVPVPPLTVAVEAR